MYRDFIFNIPSVFKKLINRYNFSTELIQYLQGDNPQVIQVFDLDLSVAQTATNPFVINSNGRAFVGYGYTSGSAILARETSAMVHARINSRSDSLVSFPALHNRGYHGDFDSLYLNWPAQTGIKMKFVVHKFDDLPWFNDGI